MLFFALNALRLFCLLAGLSDADNAAAMQSVLSALAQSGLQPADLFVDHKLAQTRKDKVCVNVLVDSHCSVVLRANIRVCCVGAGRQPLALLP